MAKLVVGKKNNLMVGFSSALVPVQTGVDYLNSFTLPLALMLTGAGLFMKNPTLLKYGAGGMLLAGAGIATSAGLGMANV